MSGTTRLRLATWNVNSLAARLPRVEEWLAYARPDVLCLQETKLADTSFPTDTFEALGYQSAHHGEGRWNGVAIVSRVGLSEVSTGLGPAHDQQGSRLVAAVCGGIRVHSVYVPNGRSLDSEQYALKLEWLDRLRGVLEETADPDGSVAVCGDFNIAPDDRDVYDPAAFEGATHVSAAERDALARIESWGLVDVFRRLYRQDGLFTWWDYRAGNFHKHLGMRIDLVLLTEKLAGSAVYALVDRNARKGSKPSDHSPLFVDLELS